MPLFSCKEDSFSGLFWENAIVLRPEKIYPNVSGKTGLTKGENIL